MLSAYPPIRPSVDPPIRPFVQFPDSLPGAGPAGRLPDPQRAGRPLEPLTARDNLAVVQAIEKQLRCTCGCGLDIYTCRTTDFNCQYSPALHRQVLDLYERGTSGPEIVAAFVREHGQSILMAPPKRGFNLAGYFAPSVLILVAAGILTLVLRRWSARGEPVLQTGDAKIDGTPAEMERLRRELEALE